MAVSREWAFTLSVLRKVYNLEVNEFFKDVSDADIEDISIARKALKRACWIRKNETQNMALIKQNIFRFVVQRVQDKPTIVGISKGELEQLFKHQPEIHFYFKQDPEAVNDGYHPIELELKIHLVNEESTTITESKLKTIANKIKTEFGQAHGFLVNKGKDKYSYEDLDKGLKNSLNAISEAEAVEVFKKLCEIVGATYDSNKVSAHPSKRASLNTPPTQLILGQSLKKPRWRPTGKVRFKYAYAKLHGLPNPQYLVDLTGRHRSSYLFN